MSDFNHCRKCERATGVTKELRCDSCGEMICLVCGCTESRACVAEGFPCGWARRGVCTACAGAVDPLGNPNGDQVAVMVIENQANNRTNH